MKPGDVGNAIERFVAKVRPTRRGCWEWRGTKNNEGYGMFFRNGRKGLAHRYAWSLFNGARAPGIVVLHTCDNPGCVNPAHLKSGTHTDNVRDCKEKGRFQAPPNLVGVNNLNAKLDPDKVRTIRAEAGPYDYDRIAELAARFGVSKPTIRQVVKGVTWNHVQ